jgi:hypothetical protein
LSNRKIAYILKFLINNTDDVYYSGDHHYSIDDTTVYSGMWFSEDTHSGELVVSEAVKLVEGRHHLCI